MNDTFIQEKKWLFTIVALVGVLLSVFIAVKTLHEWREYRNESFASYGPTIDVSGEGEVMAVPDIATFNYGVEAKAKTVAEAQTKAAEVSKKALDFLKESGVAERDIKSSSYNVYPEYVYQELKVSCLNGICPPSGNQVLVGYTASAQVEVKVRAIEKAGELVDGVGRAGATNISGVQFTIDDKDELEREARELAIADAKKKARELARDLGVSLVRIVSYSENGQPVYYERAYDAKVMNASAGSVAPTTSFSVGENKIMSNVQLTFEIR